MFHYTIKVFSSLQSGLFDPSTGTPRLFDTRDNPGGADESYKARVLGWMKSARPGDMLVVPKLTLVKIGSVHVED